MQPYTGADDIPGPFNLQERIPSPDISSPQIHSGVLLSTLTDDIPPDGDEKKLPGSFSATRHLTAAGCSFWLQKFMKDPVPITSRHSERR